MTKFTLANLEKRVHERAKASAADSYTMVVLEARGISLAEVEAELEKRTAQSGHQEKASRA